MVSTPTVLEAARKSSLNDVDLEGLYQYLKEFKGYSINKKENENKNENKGAIITVCSSGKGAAIKLKELVVDIVKNISDENVDVIPIGIKNCKEEIKKIGKNNKILAIVGSIDPNLNVPFISLESLISGKGEKIIEKIFKGESILLEEDIQGDIVLNNLCYDSLKETITYLNPDKINNLLLEFTNILEEITHRDFTNSMKVRIVLHTACALERVLTNDELKYSYDIGALDESIVSGIKQATYMFKEALNLQLSDDEIYYLAEILLL